jgi:hypothetical protein
VLGVGRSHGGDEPGGAPGHSAEDRSVSLLLQDDRVVVHTFGDGDWRSVLDFLREQQLIDASNAPLAGPGRGRRGSAVPTPSGAMRPCDCGSPAGRSPARSPSAIAACAASGATSPGRRRCVTTTMRPSPPTGAVVIAGRRCWPGSRMPTAGYGGRGDLSGAERQTGD